MKLKSLLLLSSLLCPLWLSGCQSNMGGQTLPSAYYLRDDVQYFPSGPEEQLPNMKRAIQNYQLQQSGAL